MTDIINKTIDKSLLFDGKIKEIDNGFITAYVDSDWNSNTLYKPEFISNDYKKGKKVLSSIESELKKCDEFCISVAFITMSGITPLLQVLKELEEKNIRGKILTTDYLTFSDPKALEKLSSLKNIKLKMFCTDAEVGGFHTKGYIFRDKEIYRIIVGSSNMTLNAITKNREWNTKIVSTENGEFTKDILNEFESLWNSDYSLDFENFIDEYKIKYKSIKKQRQIAKSEKVTSLKQYKLTPNKMQVSFISSLSKMILSGEKRALLISATGTGKTFASAFALREMNPKKVLFIVHREQIAKQAKRSYEMVFGHSKTFGILSGNEKETNADFLFSTMQMMSKENILSYFKSDEFDVIVIDEVHRAGSESYNKIISYFKPDFLLGMTASPERTDGFDIYSLFNHNIAYEIRLQQALEENLLCPFHYFGITDLEVDGKIISDDDHKNGLCSFNNLTCDSRVNYIIEKANYYGYCGERVKGLIFCSGKDEGKELSRKFNEHGYNTEFLCGDDSQIKREEYIDRLTDDEREDKLDYLFTVDIFNEGVDIPEINQVIMLRPTESPIIFIQQLGRGLRKADGKEYVVILDFIGNYNNNFMIPIALSGDRTYNKDNIRRYMLEGERIIPGSSTIHFDAISKKRIFSAIDVANFSNIKLIKEHYKKLKNKLGRIPRLKDFDDYGEMDALRIFDSPSLGSYYRFLVNYEKDYTIRLNTYEEKCIEFISKKLASGKRIHELKLLELLLSKKKELINCLEGELEATYNIKIDHNTIKNIINVMTNNFPSGSSKNTYKDCIFIKQSGEDYIISDTFSEMLCNYDFYEIVKELVKFGIERYNKNYSKRYKNTNFVLYEKYTYEDVCRLLEWESNEVPLNIGGYKYDSKTKTLPVFINYEKDDNISDTIKYEDRFLSSNHLISISKQSRTINSEDVQNFLKAEERGIDIELFVRKNKDDKISKEFYYLGKIKSTGKAEEFIMPNTSKTAVEIEWILDVPVREDIYKYIIG